MNTINTITEKQVVMKSDQIEKHSTTRSLVLHLLPGILVGAFYFLRTSTSCQNGVYLTIFALFIWH